MPNIVCKDFDTATRKGLSRQFQQYPATYGWFLPAGKHVKVWGKFLNCFIVNGFIFLEYSPSNHTRRDPDNIFYAATSLCFITRHTDATWGSFSRAAEIRAKKYHSPFT